MFRFIAFTIPLMLAACSSPTPDAQSEQAAVNAGTAAGSNARDLAVQGTDPTPLLDRDATIANQAITSENYAEVMSARAREYDRKEYKPVTLTDFEAGDNSYLEIVRRIEGSPFETVLCTAPQCANWRDAGGLPSGLKNKEVTAKFGTADQVDGAGKVMKRNVEAIVDLRFATRSASAGRPGRSVPEQVPLTPGVYVLDGTGCKNPANAAWRVWDGEGLSGSTTKDCRATILSRKGDTYTLRNSCQNTYDGSRSDETLAMTVTDQVHFSIKGRSFASCSMAQVPSELRELVTGRAN